MKINRFNLVNEKLSDEVNNYIEDFIGSVDDSVYEWISTVAKETTLKEYKYVDIENDSLSKNKILEFLQQKNLKKLQALNSLILRKSELIKEIEKLENKQEIIKIEASNEVLYKFQEDLLINDFGSFYIFFIRDRFDEGDVIDFEQADIHPNILKKYRKKIKILIDAMKYNL